jgi:hypothetical protein
MSRHMRARPTLGSAASWFAADAADAREWLIRHRLIDLDGRITHAVR